MFEIFQANLDEVSHASALLELLDHYARDPMGGGQGLSEYVLENLLAELKKRDDLLVVLAFHGPRPAGLVNCFEGFSTFKAKPLMNIHDVVVHSDYRGQGLSTRMREKVEQLARQRNCCKLTLEVLQGNRVAQGAYRKAGFSGYQLDPAMGQALFWEKSLE
jgi:ribosomal protein S18 acetylase RimI-like enzyme